MFITFPCNVWEAEIAQWFPVSIAWFISPCLHTVCTAYTVNLWHLFRGCVHFIMAVFVHLLNPDHVISSFVGFFCCEVLVFVLLKSGFPRKIFFKGNICFLWGWLGTKSSMTCFTLRNELVTWLRLESFPLSCLLQDHRCLLQQLYQRSLQIQLLVSYLANYHCKMSLPV